jgi:hypothetical protein
MSRIHLIGGEKGGVGKSFFARVLCQYFVDRDQPLAAIDADLSHATLARCYGEFTQAIDLERLESADGILDRALGADRRVVVDLPAQSLRLLDRWLESGQVISLARELQVPFTFWHVTDGGHDSVKALQLLLDRHGRSFRCVAVKNHGRGRSFELYDEARIPVLLDQYAGRQLDFPELDAATAHAVDRAGASFWAASQRGETGGLTQLARARTRRWLDQCYDGLDQLDGLL